MATQQLTKNCISLKGSASLVKEYLNYGVNSILYQRGIYPAESFQTEEHFGITTFMSSNEKIKEFLTNVLTQIEDWLVKKKVERITLVINDVKTKETLERWDFKVQYEVGVTVGKEGEETGKKELKEIQKEIRDVLRQITATISFLPLLDRLCSFDILVQTVQDADVPQLWDETQPCFITNSQEVQLRTFSTSLHRMETFVSYKGE
ncbi:hypothetical protein R5R35_003110 [Gryllus longicercus]|uniref:Mitotic spindle assembly checkpoint protein MAD2A n=1 Tax=Gryllus longicercus TaxID=2509291 RepID=A0AAN9Z6G6_9ORTH|nr:Mitotic spindle assembly checkpoint protein MAD2A [Gryllus bimaculatus]